MKKDLFFYSVEKCEGKLREHLGVFFGVGSERVRGGTVIWSPCTCGFAAWKLLFRAISTGISKFVRMRNPDLSGKSGCEMRRNPGNRYRDIEICPDAKSGSVRKIRM